MRPALVALLLAPLAASAQDMPLFTFTRDGEGWVKADGKKPDKPEGGAGVITIVSAFYPQLFGSKYNLPISFKEYGPLGKPSSMVATADGGTVYVGFGGESAVWAFTPNKDNNLTNGAPYAPLRIRKAYDNSKEAREKLKTNPPTLAVTALALDSAGRLYAATTENVQVFDPTGRLCGSLVLPERGKVEALAWEGKDDDSLAAWVGERKWTRTMNPAGK